VCVCVCIYIYIYIERERERERERGMCVHIKYIVINQAASVTEITSAMQ
jgi:hypothetical protein